MKLKDIQSNCLCNFNVLLNFIKSGDRLYKNRRMYKFSYFPQYVTLGRNLNNFLIKKSDKSSFLLRRLAEIF